MLEGKERLLLTTVTVKRESRIEMKRLTMTDYVKRGFYKRSKQQDWNRSNCR